MKFMIYLLVGLVAISVAAAGTAPSHSFDVGSPFPVIALPSLDGGRPMSVEDFRGRKLVLHIWASW
jgi:hypothetical protein